MIGNFTTGKGGKWLAKHLARTDRNEKVFLFETNNMTFNSIEDCVNELTILSERSTFNSPILHLSLSPNPNDPKETSMEDLADLEKRLLKEFKLEEQQYFSVIHRKVRDTDGRNGDFHIHYVFNISKENGQSCDNLSNNYIRFERIVKEWQIERGFQLTPVKHEKALLKYFEVNKPEYADILKKNGICGTSPTRIAAYSSIERAKMEDKGITKKTRHAFNVRKDLLSIYKECLSDDKIDLDKFTKMLNDKTYMFYEKDNKLFLVDPANITHNLTEILSNAYRKIDGVSIKQADLRKSFEIEKGKENGDIRQDFQKERTATETKNRQSEVDKQSTEFATEKIEFVREPESSAKSIRWANTSKNSEAITEPASEPKSATTADRHEHPNDFEGSSTNTGSSSEHREDSVTDTRRQPDWGGRGESAGSTDRDTKPDSLESKTYGNNTELDRRQIVENREQKNLETLAKANLFLFNRSLRKFNYEDILKDIREQKEIREAVSVIDLVDKSKISRKMKTFLFRLKNFLLSDDNRKNTDFMKVVDLTKQSNFIQVNDLLGLVKVSEKVLLKQAKSKLGSLIDELKNRLESIVDNKSAKFKREIDILKRRIYVSEFVCENSDNHKFIDRYVDGDYKTVSKAISLYDEKEREKAFEEQRKKLDEQNRKVEEKKQREEQRVVTRATSREEEKEHRLLKM